MKKLEAEDDSKQIDDTFNMRHAKFDVHHFAIRGLAKEDKESAQIAHAIKLGAKVSQLLKLDARLHHLLSPTSFQYQTKGYKICVDAVLHF